ncbi:MAG: protein phosphatase 1 regulatory subunit 42 [Oscillospiraceae bacterium]|nr:protein phosphatase 1 regulatory subunit 42 [Oscillospiraceae bacterium]
MKKKIFTFISALIIMLSFAACDGQAAEILKRINSSSDNKTETAESKTERVDDEFDSEGRTPKLITIKGEMYSTYLTELDLSEMGLSNTDIEPLKYMVHLKELYLWDNRISDLSPLSELVNLTVLDLDYNKITDITPLSGLVNLEELYLSENRIEDITPLSGLTALSELYLWDNRIVDITPLSELNDLVDLDLYGNRINDLTPLHGLSGLMWLDVCDNPFSDEQKEALEEALPFCTIYFDYDYDDYDNYHNYNDNYSYPL